jgi:hypothetical protein
MAPFWRQAAAAGFLLFVVLLVVGLVHGVTHPHPPTPAWQLQLASREESSKRQSVNNLKQLGLAKMALPLVLDQADVERIQVYEKSADLVVGTSSFPEDEARARAALAAHEATLFNETNTGIVPRRSLTLEIGVPPDKFDDLVEALREIGHLDSVSVQQRDRTGDFRRLHAQRLALKKHQESVLKLRGAGKGSVDDALKVEQKIQDVEKELQSLSVLLGDFLGKESFYHVRITLSERQPGSGQMGQAFLWALTWWSASVGVVGVLAGTMLSAWTLWPRRGPAGPAA